MIVDEWLGEFEMVKANKERKEKEKEESQVNFKSSRSVKTDMNLDRTESPMWFYSLSVEERSVETALFFSYIFQRWFAKDFKDMKKYQGLVLSESWVNSSGNVKEATEQANFSKFPFKLKANVH